MSLYFNTITIRQAKQLRSGNCFELHTIQGKKSCALNNKVLLYIAYCMNSAVSQKYSLCFEFFMVVVPFWELLRSLCYSIVSHNEIIGMTIICLFGFKSFLCSIPSIVSLAVPWCDISCLPRFQEQQPKKNASLLLFFFWRSASLNTELNGAILKVLY